MTRILLPLVNNAALLLSLAVVFDTMARRERAWKSVTVQILTGLCVAVTGVAVMMNPLRLTDGVIFDTRSILLCISGLYFGAVPTLMGLTATAATRIIQGGGGTLMGVSVITASGLLGILWRLRRKGRLEDISGLELYLLGLAVHAVMVALMGTLPKMTVLQVLPVIAPSVMIVYPVGTVLLGLFLSARLRRARSRSELEEREENLRITLQSIGDAVITVNLERRVLRMNPVAEELTGFSFDESKGSLLEDVFHIMNAETRQIVDNPVEEVLETGRTMGLANHTVLVSKNGTEYQISDSAAPLRDSDGAMVGVVLVFRDVTGTYEQERKLKESEARYRSLFENNHTVIMIVDPSTGAVVEANPAATAFYGWSKERLDTLNVFQHSSLSEEDLRIGMRQIIAGEKNHFVARHHRADESVRDVDVFTGPIHYRGQTFLYMIIHDITERKQAEEALHRSLEEREVLIRELYHRTKNNMQVIVSLLSLKRRQLHNPELQEILIDMETKISSMALVHQRLYMSRNLSFIALNEYLRELADMIRSTYGARAADIEFRIELDHFTVLLDTAIPVGLVVNELITNALKYAFPESGKGVLAIRLTRRPDDVAELVISDDGKGIPETTPPGKPGTIGIEMVRSIVENQLAGTIILDRGNGGTTWRITFSENLYRERI